MRIRCILLQFVLPALCVLAIFLFTGCASSADLPAVVAEAYIEALANKDLGRMVQASCGSFQTEARAEFDTYAGIEIQLETLECKVTAMAGREATVSCTGAFAATVGAEFRPIPFDARIFHIKHVEGMWRVCGSG